MFILLRLPTLFGKTILPSVFESPAPSSAPKPFITCTLLHYLFQKECEVLHREAKNRGEEINIKEDSGRESKDGMGRKRTHSRDLCRSPGRLSCHPALLVATSVPAVTNEVKSKPDVTQERVVVRLLLPNLQIGTNAGLEARTTSKSWNAPGRAGRACARLCSYTQGP